jgi:hypothetical protein
MLICIRWQLLLLLMPQLNVCLLCCTLQGVTYICRMLTPHGLTRSEVAALLALNEQMGHAFDQSLTSILKGLVLTVR